MKSVKEEFDIQKLPVRVLIVALALAVCFAAVSCGRRTKAGVFDNSGYAVLDEVPEWSGDPSVEVNGGKPEFERSEIRKAKRAVRRKKSFQVFTEMDRFGRCGSAVACVGSETMPTGERDSIGMIKPSGWQLSKYDFIDNGGYLYNRCHLIGWQLTGENDELRNLITGTRYMNVQGMLPFENRVADYVRRTGNHVLYRSTPIFRREELVARGVVLEAYSLEDKGKSLSFNVYCYNVQPGVTISYKTGKNRLDESTLPDGYVKPEEAQEEKTEESTYEELDIPEGVTYILNKNTMRFHRLDCEGAKTIREHNREWFYGTREEAVEEGFVPCGMCKP